jgi:hypothetical protein
MLLAALVLSFSVVVLLVLLHRLLGAEGCVADATDVWLEGKKGQ